MEDTCKSMEFTRVGKTYQLVVSNGNDLKDALLLDEALWAATSAPTDSFRCDPALMTVLDPAKTGRITASSLKKAISWLLDKISDPTTITADNQEELSLKNLNPATAQPLLDSARYILEKVASKTTETITIKQVRDFFDNVAKLPFNGDGVISLAGAEQISADFKKTLTDVIATMGGTQDADGTTGATPKHITDFLATVKDYLAWYRQGEIPDGQVSTDIMPMGKDTPQRYQLVRDADPRIQQFFTLSRLMAFDQRIEGKTMGTEARLTAFDPTDPGQVDAFLNALPLAQPNSSLTLPVSDSEINPSCRNLWHDLMEMVAKPLLGQDVAAITPENWSTIRNTFAPYETYRAAQKGATVEKLPLDTLKYYELHEQEIIHYMEQALVKDKTVADINVAAKEVEKLLLLVGNVIRFANNFISFPELYDPNQRALFEQGSLVIDGRWFNLAFKVANVPAHQALAKRSLLCIIYVEVDPTPAPKFNLAIPVTYGSIGNLAVGKRGVFIDLNGRESDAKITHLIANPVCIREAILAPFFKMGKLVEGKIETWSNASEKNALADFNKAVTNPSATMANNTSIAPKQPADKQNMFLGASVAIAALGSAFAFISNSLSAMSTAALSITVICALLALVAPLTIMAFIKLNKQDLSAMLEGCGWAINLRMKLTTRLRGQFTRFGNYPENAKGTPKSRVLLATLLIILILVALSYSVNWIAENTDWGQQHTPSKQPTTTVMTVKGK